MNWIIEPERQIPVAADVDVLVCGGGFAGVAAAVCAARNGAGVLLVERYGFLGGLVTGGLVITTPPLDNGINREIARRLQEQQVYKPLRNPGAEMIALKMRAIDPEVVKFELAQMLQEQNVHLLLHTLIVGSVVEQNVLQGYRHREQGGPASHSREDGGGCHGRCRCRRLRGRAVSRGEEAHHDDVQHGRAWTWRRCSPRSGNWSNLKKVVTQAVDRGELSFQVGHHPGVGHPGRPRRMPDPSRRDQRLVGKPPWDGRPGPEAAHRSGADHPGPRDATRRRFLRKQVSGFEGPGSSAPPPCSACAPPGRSWAASPPTCTRPEHDVPGHGGEAVRRGRHPAPLRKSLLPQGVDNLLVAGRCISADEEAMGQLRLIPVCSATGQAAGTAAALAVREGLAPGKLDVSQLQKVLTARGWTWACNVRGVSWSVLWKCDTPDTSCSRKQSNRGGCHHGSGL